MLGDLKDSGWTTALTEAEVASAGTADSFVSASHVKKTHLSQQVRSQLALFTSCARQPMTNTYKKQRIKMLTV